MTDPSDFTLPPRLRRRWLELDLSAAAEAGQLPRAYEAEAPLARLAALLDRGQRLILTGKAGVGKTALVQELVARAQEGEAPQRLAGQRVLQLSFERCLAQVGPEGMALAFRELREGLAEAEGVVPFFCDLDLLFHHDLEAQLEELCDSYPGLILGEGSPRITRAILEYFPPLQRAFERVVVEEPSLERTRRILEAWAAQHGRLTEAALDEALSLSERFLPRQHRPRKALELLAQAARSARAKSLVDAQDVIDRFCLEQGAPPWLFDPSEGADADEVHLREGRSRGRPPRRTARWPERSGE